MIRFLHYLLQSLNKKLRLIKAEFFLTYILKSLLGSSKELVCCNYLCKMGFVIDDPLRNRMCNLPLIEMIFLHFKTGNDIIAKIYFYKIFAAGRGYPVKVYVQQLIVVWDVCGKVHVPKIKTCTYLIYDLGQQNKHSVMMLVNEDYKYLKTDFL